MAEQQPDVVEKTREKDETRITEPPMYRVVMYNDDFTTKEFVVEILVVVFHKALAEATELMWRIHRRGRGVAGVYALEIAETKAAVVIETARENGFPLKLSLEPEGAG
jgi:ATP-dependent Clp protease adaptor protein ClpS